MVVMVLGLLPARAASPPTTVNYQGVLRDQNDLPLTGTFDMVFRFMSAPTAGTMILADQHTAAGGNAVTVANGLFNVALGSGTIIDGSGFGLYTSLDPVFRDYSSVWLEVQVGAEILSPLTQFHSSPYALNSMRLAGLPEDRFIRTSIPWQELDGALHINNGYPEFGGLGVSSVGDNAIFALSNTGTAVHGEVLEGTGGEFFGTTRGVLAQCSLSGCIGLRAIGDPGIFARGTMTGGHFENSLGPTADIATSNKGISATGGDYGGFFTSTTPGSTGVYATGIDKGVGAEGGNYGGYFQSNANYGVYASGGESGVWGTGGTYGGFFLGDTDTGVYAEGGYAGFWGLGGDRGVYGNGGNYGGYFDAFLTGSYGIQAAGVQTGVRGIGGIHGGHFSGSGGSNSVVASSSYKIAGTGSVSFVQNHPTDPSKVVVYAAPEGDEVAVYTRGSGRLVNGEARVRLGETFALVTNPDIGLTATATPRGEPIPLAVSEVGTSEVVVRGPAGSNAEFDYMVWGLRVGFEKQSIIQPKKDDSKIPSMYEHEQFFRDDPELFRHTALARFKDVDAAVRGRKNADLSRSDQLRDSIGVFQYRGPEKQADGPGRPAGLPPAAGAGVGKDTDATGTAPHLPARERAGLPTRGADGSDEDGRMFVPAAGLDLFTMKGVIEAGDVVSLVADAPGSVVRSAHPSDALVIGCAQTSQSDSAGSTSIRPGSGLVAVAASNVALCRVDASYGAIAVGDRLTASAMPGLAMRADLSVAGATILGRAIDPLPSGDGLVRVLLGAR